MSLSEDEAVDYSAYITYQSSGIEVYALLSGFMLTAIVLLLTMLPDPGQIFTQITLFILAMFLKMNLFYTDSKLQVLLRCVKVAPPLPQATLTYLRVLRYVTGYGLEITIVLIFLVWNLLYLALATSTALVTLSILHYIVHRPFDEYYAEKWIRK